MKTITILFLALISASSIIAQQQMLNAGFEEWENVWVGTDEPVNWSSIKTSDNADLNMLAPVVWGPSSDAHTGNFSLSLTNVGSIIVATGMITNGRVHSEIPATLSYVYTNRDEDAWHGVLTDRPDSVVGWFKCNPEVGDFGTVKFLLHTGDAQLPGDELNGIAQAYYELPSADVTQWTRFSVPFVYSSGNNPEYILAVLTSGNGVDAIIGSTALFDDIELIYNPSDVDQLAENQLKVFIKDQYLNLSINDKNNQQYDIKIIDINGHIVLKTIVDLNENNRINISNFEPGVYIVTANNNQKILTQKVIIN
ncbi:MAG: T9SS type A sorting domain-containing protein [Bacteroidota bacterium]